MDDTLNFGQSYCFSFQNNLAAADYLVCVSNSYLKHWSWIRTI